MAARSKWFYLRLERLPYRDVIDRPLLISQLLFLYKREGYLPDKPVFVYRKLVRLLLQDWDIERGLCRRSMYGAFDPDRKAEFLQQLAFQLTINTKCRTFSREQLIAAYRAVYMSFELPIHDAEKVVAELETHTGIIARAGFNKFEFSHLSLQEYLCAEYLVRCPLRKDLLAYLHKYPAPLAIATALSASPSEWVIYLVLGGHGSAYGGAPPSWPASAVFVERLCLERPVFQISKKLGAAFINLLFQPNCPLEIIRRTMKVSGVPESLLQCLHEYMFIGTNRTSKEYLLEWDPTGETEGWDLPEMIQITPSQLDEILGNKRITMRLEYPDDHSIGHVVVGRGSTVRYTGVQRENKPEPEERSVL